MTKEDLQQIEKLLEPIKNQLTHQGTDIQNLTSVVSEQGKDIKTLSGVVSEQGQDIKNIKKTVRYIKKTVDVLIDVTDRNNINAQKRLDRIENHLGLPHPSLTGL